MIESWTEDYATISRSTFQNDCQRNKFGGRAGCFIATGERFPSQWQSSARLARELRKPQSLKVADCSANFISRRVGKSMWIRGMRVTIFLLDSTAVLSAVSTGREFLRWTEKERARYRLLLLSRRHFVKTCETVSENGEWSAGNISCRILIVWIVLK